METIGLKEVLEFAVKLEENGIKFYTEFAEKAQQEIVNKIFLFLANEEKKHLKEFERMVSTAAEENRPALSEGTTQELLNAYAKAFFPGEEAAEEKPIKDLSPLEATSLGIKTEQYSISYYQKIKSLAPQRDHRSIDRILREERQHYEKLTELKEKLREHKEIR